MMSPTPAVRRFEPPSTLMHWTRLAPLLSATSRLDCIWIMVRPYSLSISSLGFRFGDIFGLGFLRRFSRRLLLGFFRGWSRGFRWLGRQYLRLRDLNRTDLGCADAIDDLPRL